MLVLTILAVVWVAVLVPPLVRNHRDGRPHNSVVSFRAQLSTLQRATPGTSLRSSSAMTPAVRRPVPGHVAASDLQRRRRDILVGLLAASGFASVLLVVVGGALVTFLFVASAGSLGAYVYALRQRQLRSLERVAKVRPLVPRPVPAPVLALRRTISG